MADIFISYANEDADRIAPLANALEDFGWSVWWDRSIPPGKTFVQAINEAISEAECVVVLWSDSSIESEWVQEEATIGKRRNILVPARIDPVEPPLGFGLVQAADLTDWETETYHPEFEKLIKAIIKFVGSPPKLRKTKAAAEKTESSLNERSQQQSEDGDSPKPVQARHKGTKAWKFEKNSTASIKRDGINIFNPTKFSYIMKFGALFGVISLLFLGGWWWIFSQYNKKVTPIVSSSIGGTESVATKLAKLYVKTVPENATVTIPEISRTFSQGMELKPGHYGINVAAEGYAQLNRQIELSPGEEKRLTLELTKVPPKLAKLYVETIPKNATVTFPDANKTFSQGMELEPGRYRIRVAMEGYEPKDKWVFLAPGKRPRFNVELKKIQPQPARLYVETVPENAIVTIPEISQAFSQDMELKSGRYRVEVAAEGYKTQVKWVQLAAGERKRINFELTQKTITNDLGMEFVLISEGKFIMGGNSMIGFETERPTRSVKISRPFYLQKTEVTQRQWKKVMGRNPSRFKSCIDCPVESVSWNETQKFIKKLNEMVGKEIYRLPTEAEWEYAARAGTTTLFSFGDNKDRLKDFGWFTFNAGGRTQIVGKKKPNPWGLYDMHGNVGEWVEDDWYENYNGAPGDERAWLNEPRVFFRVVRGCNWECIQMSCRSARRFTFWPVWRSSVVGFRLARRVSNFKNSNGPNPLKR